jgi:hypothetical protein
MCRCRIRRIVLPILFMMGNWILDAQTTTASKCAIDLLPHVDGLSSQQRTREVLLDADENNAVSEVHLCNLKKLEQPITALAAFLGDTKLASSAVEAMMKIDAAAAAPYLAQNAHEPDTERIFEFYYTLGLVNPMPWRSDLHQLARRELEADRLSRNAIYVLGVTGDAKDIPLLNQIYARGINPAHAASEAALARLGSSFHLNNIETELHKTLSTETKKSEKLYQTVQATLAIEAAGFSNNERFIPLLCNHLHDPSDGTEDQTFLPASNAVRALALIVDHKLLPGIISQDENKQWESRCDTLKR